MAGRYRGPLHGIPVAVKDTHYTKGIKSTCASPVLADFVPSFDATIVTKLKDAGAILLGKTNLPEFSSGSSGNGTNNPWNLTKPTGDRAPGMPPDWAPECSSGRAAATPGLRFVVPQPCAVWLGSSRPMGGSADTES